MVWKLINHLVYNKVCSKYYKLLLDSFFLLLVFETVLPILNWPITQYVAYEDLELLIFLLVPLKW